MRLLLLLRLALTAGWLLGLALGSARAGNYGQNFEGLGDLGDGSALVSSHPIPGAVQLLYGLANEGRQLQLSQAALPNTRGAYLLPDLDPGRAIGGFTATWDCWVFGDFPDAGDGFSFTFGPVRSLNLVETDRLQEFGYGVGLTVSVFTGPGIPGIRLFANGVRVAGPVLRDSTATWGNYSAARHRFAVSWLENQGLSVSLDGTVLFTNVVVPGFTPAVGDSFVWAARSGNSGQTLQLDNVAVSTQFTPRIVSLARTLTLAPPEAGGAAQISFAAQVDPGGLPTTVIAEAGTTSAYGFSVTNQLAAADGPIPFSVLLTFAAGEAKMLHSRLTLSNSLGTVTTGDLTLGPPTLQSALATNEPAGPRVECSAAVDTQGQATTVFVEVGTDTAYGTTAIYQLAATNDLVPFSALVPFETPHAMTLHARLTVSNLLATATSGDLTFASPPFRRSYSVEGIGTLPVSGALAWMDLDNDGWLDFANAGRSSEAQSGDLQVSAGGVYYNPGSAGGVWQRAMGPDGFRPEIAVADLDNDNRPDAFFATGPEYSSTFGNRRSAGQLEFNSGLFYGTDYRRRPLADYRNEDFCAFLGVQVGPARVSAADFDRDGRTDLLVAGFWWGVAATADDRPQSVLYHNEFAGTRTTNATGFNIRTNVSMRAISQPIPGLGSSDLGGAPLTGHHGLAVGDLNGDGFSDAYGFRVYHLTGSETTRFPTDTWSGVYLGDGGTGFREHRLYNLNLPYIPPFSAQVCSTVLADFNGDGFLDLLLSYTDQPLRYDWTSGIGKIRIWLNDGQGNLTESTTILPALGLANLAVGDIFNHGRNDILMSGYSDQDYSYPETIVLRNEGGGVFTPFSLGRTGGASEGGNGLQLADYDKDGRLDFCVSGDTGPLVLGPSDLVVHRPVVAVYRNELDIPANTPPAAPTGLTAAVGPGVVRFGWNPATDDHTPANLLTYNLRIGTAPGGTDAVSPMADLATGWRKLAAPGNCGHGTNVPYHLPPGTYYWSLQAIDGGFQGGAWASEGSFVVPATPEAVADSVARVSGRSLKIPVGQLRANDRFAATQPATVVAVDAVSAGGVSVQLADGFVLYSPAPGFNAADSFTYTLSDGVNQATATVNISVEDLPETPTQNLTGMTVTGAGAVAVTAAGIPGRRYQLQHTTSLASPVTWAGRGAAQTAPANGQMVFMDPTPTSPGFYRVVRAQP